ncbi:orexigenic neuropeptide QRFP-like [Amia ocellicauda]|uniref:orexigenic neuropeptide QRFP-like n=1 Tax=Amia ocellicauda TaxID=2972642 RepID=UPI003464AF9A
MDTRRAQWGEWAPLDWTLSYNVCKTSRPTGTVWMEVCLCRVLTQLCSLTSHRQMQATSPLCVLLLLELGRSFTANGLDRACRARRARENLAITRDVWRPPWAAPVGPWEKKSQEADSLVRAVMELQGQGQVQAKERAGFRFRFGRGEEEEEEEGEALQLLGEEDWAQAASLAHKRSGTLQTLAEELNGYRRKVGISFRFGRK